MNITLDYEYAIIYINLTSDNLLFDSIKISNEKNKDLDLVYFIDIENFKLQRGQLEHSIPRVFVMISHFIELFNNGLIYICCEPNQSEDLRRMIETNKDKLGDFELKVVVGSNIIKLI